jgi:hypothetical protein
MWSWRSVLRISLGILVVLHALGHSVLLLRGELEYPPSSVPSAIALGAYVSALVGLFAAGMGILGSLIFRKYVGALMGVGLVASVVALILGWNESAWWGLALDAALVGVFAAAKRAGVLLGAGATPECHGIARASRWIGEAIACALVAYVAIGALIWPWHRRWGTTPAERRLELPGDPITRNLNYELMHAVTIEAPPEQVWTWLVQIGQDRAGFYSYDWLERLLLADVHNVSEIRPEWQRRAVGDFVRATPPNYMGGIFGRDVGWKLSYVDPGRAMVFANWGAFVLEPDGPGRTRFFIRSSIGAPDAPVWGAGLTFALFELPHFIMERKMMLTIKKCAERSMSIARVQRSASVN